MNVNEYQQKALRSALLDRPLNDQLMNAALGLAGEAGEVSDLVKKFFFHGHPLNREKLIDELGDIQWYIVLGCVGLGVTLEEVMQRNIEKLLKRYPDKFSTEASINRSE